MKVSFDFDSTLSTSLIQRLAKRHIQYGDEVHITTTRQPEDDSLGFTNEYLYKVADRLGIKRENIHFTKYQDKVHFLKSFDIHYDDDEHEIDLITRSDLSCLGILINYKNYNLDNEEVKK
tara:strand:- start:426 stop:785 length:360 start_codon:yes stop_codon:yes gene_type:complete